MPPAWVVVFPRLCAQNHVFAGVAKFLKIPELPARTGVGACTLVLFPPRCRLRPSDQTSFFPADLSAPLWLVASEGAGASGPNYWVSRSFLAFPLDRVLSV